MTPSFKALITGNEANNINGEEIYKKEAVLILSIGVYAPVNDISIHFSRNTIKDYREMEAEEASIEDILGAHRFILNEIALDKIKSGLLMVDEYYHGYKLIDGEIYRYRKGSGELFTEAQFLQLDYTFSIAEVEPPVD